IIINLGILSIVLLGLFTFISSFYKQIEIIESKNKALGLASELRAISMLPSECSKSVSKLNSDYPSVNGDGSITLQDPDPGFPVSFTLASGSIVEGGGQSGPVQIESFRMMGAQLVNEENDVLNYRGHLVLRVLAGSTEANRRSLAPLP